MIVNGTRSPGWLAAHSFTRRCTRTPHEASGTNCPPSVSITFNSCPTTGVTRSNGKFQCFDTSSHSLNASLSQLTLAMVTVWQNRRLLFAHSGIGLRIGQVTVVEPVTVQVMGLGSVSAIAISASIKVIVVSHLH